MFGEWITGIIGISVLGIFLDIVVSKGETEKYVTGMFGLFTLLVLVSPLPKLINSDFSFESVFDFKVSDIQTDEDFVELVYRKRYDQLESDLCDKISQKYQTDCSADIYFVESCPEKIDIVYLYLKNSSIREDEENKHISVEIQNTICNVLNIDSKKVVVSWQKTNT